MGQNEILIAQRLLAANQQEINDHRSAIQKTKLELGCAKAELTDKLQLLEAAERLVTFAQSQDPATPLGAEHPALQRLEASEMQVALIASNISTKQESLLRLRAGLRELLLERAQLQQALSRNT